MGIGRAIWMGILVAKNVQRLQSQGMVHRAPNVKDQVTQILANSFRINTNAAVNGIKTYFGNMGIDVENLSLTPPPALEQLSSADRLQLRMMSALISARDWMESAGRAIETNNVSSWTRKSQYQVPKCMQIEEFTLCDPSLPITVIALKQVIYAFLCILDASGFRNTPWEQVAINPCFRGMLGIEEPDEFIITAIEGKEISWEPSIAYTMPLHDIIEAGSKAKTWWIAAKKPSS